MKNLFSKVIRIFMTELNVIFNNALCLLIQYFIGFLIGSWLLSAISSYKIFID